MSIARQVERGRNKGPTSPDMPEEWTASEALVISYLSDTPENERLETARAIIRALNTLRVKQYRDRKRGKKSP